MEGEVTMHPVEQNPFVAAFQRARARTEAIAALVHEDAYLARPIPVRLPFVFYDGHLSAFNWNALFRKTLGVPSFNPAFDARFGRGIDPEAPGAGAPGADWPSRSEVQAYKREVNARLMAFLEGFDPQAPPHPWLADGRVLHIMLEHELMHQETLLYMVHQLPASLKKPPSAPGAGPLAASPSAAASERPREVAILAGPACLGVHAGDVPFAWDNERPCHLVDVPAFRIDATPCTNGRFMEFVEAGGYRRPEFWAPAAWERLQRAPQTHPRFWRQTDQGWVFHGLFEDLPLPLDWPVLVSQAEAEAYARFKGKRLPTEAEWHRAAFGDDMARPYPWGWEAPTPEHGNFDFQRFSPAPVGTHPKGATPLGVHDLLGNGWEWTCTPFAPFEGFEADPRYPGYSADFFDGKHVVMKGGSWATDAKLLRRSFRNWFYDHYPYAYATFRCVSPPD
jgi:ergothioneine biosynthesis protein EgtB